MLRREPHVVELACAQNGWALEFAAVFFRKDRELVLRCVRQKASSFQWASKDLKDDLEVALVACRAYGQCLKWCSPRLQVCVTVWSRRERGLCVSRHHLFR